MGESYLCAAPDDTLADLSGFAHVERTIVGVWLSSVRFLIVGVVGSLLVACSSGPGGGAGDPGTDSAWDDRVDPQILQDVVDGTYWMPGPGVRRGMRVQMFRAGN